MVYADNIFSNSMCFKVIIIVKGIFSIKTNLKCMFLLLKKIHISSGYNLKPGKQCAKKA